MGNSIYGKGVLSQSWSLDLFGYNLLPMGADPSYTTISGYSAGTFLGQSVYVSHSSTFKGAAFHDG